MSSTHTVTPTGVDAQADGSGQMFDAIAGRYDLLNCIISLGLDQSWRRQLIGAVTGAGQRKVLDLATGTGDVAIAIAQRVASIEVIGIDPSAGMLAVGAQKCRKLGLQAQIMLREGDGRALPLEDDSVDAVAMAFGIRNVPDRPRCLAELKRVTRPGGVIAILELSEPRGGLLGPLARFHVHHVVPTLGAWLSGAREYRYLQRSFAAFPPPEEFVALLEEAGLCDARATRMRFGAAHLYTATA